VLKFAFTEFYEVLCSLGMRTVGSAILRFWRCSTTTIVGSWLTKRSPMIHCQFIARVYDVCLLARKKLARRRGLTKGANYRRIDDGASNFE
jgi:hypothetical protein